MKFDDRLRILENMLMFFNNFFENCLSLINIIAVTDPKNQIDAALRDSCDIDDDIMEQIEEGKRDDAEIRNFEELAEDLGI